jgi:RimJ/RimL family protein N-acetyltransferase
VGSPPESDVLLRQVTEDDVVTFFEHQQDPVANWMAAFTAKDPADWAAFAAKWAKIRAEGSGAAQTIVCGGRVAGTVTSFVAPWSGQLEVSYWVGREHWGRGVATRALAAFVGGLAARPLYARAAADNVASIRVLEKCGFVLVGRERGFANARGAEIEEVVMELRGGGTGGADSPNQPLQQTGAAVGFSEFKAIPAAPAAER